MGGDWCLQQDPAALKHQLHPAWSPGNPRQFLRQGETLKLSELHEIKLIQNCTWKHVSWRLGNYTCLTNAAQMLATCTFPKLPNLTRWHLLYGVQVFLLFPACAEYLWFVSSVASLLLFCLSFVIFKFQQPPSLPPTPLFSQNTVGTRHLCRVDFTESFELTGETKGREENARGNISFSKHLRTEYEYSPSWSLKSSGHDPELLSRSLAQSSSWGLSLYSIPLVPVNAHPPFLSGIPTRISNV